VPTGGAVGAPRGASVGGAAIGHNVDGEQNEGMSPTELHKDSMRPLTQRHTQVAFAFAVWNPTSQTTIRTNTFIELAIAVSEKPSLF